jgi:hypothetical protein
MSARVDELATRFDAAVANVVTVVDRCTDEEWRMVCPAEGWSVAVVADHIAVYMLIQRDWIGKLANDQPMVPFTMRAIDAFNAWRAEDHAGATRSEVLTLLDHNQAIARDFVLSLTDEQLHRSRPFQRIFLDAEPCDVRDVAQCIERTLITHVRHHFVSITSTLVQSGRS